MSTTRPAADPGEELLFTDLTDAEIATAFADAPPRAASEALVPSAAARELTRTLGARHVEVIAHWASQKMRGERAADVAQRLRRVIADAMRLAGEMDEGDLLAAYETLDEIVDGFSAASTAGARRRSAKRLRDWTLDFAELVGGEAGDRLRGLVVFNRGAYPLLERLREIRGVGPRRLERLYAAGLATTDALAEADPDELMALIGLPAPLALEVVRVSRAFAETERRETVLALTEMTHEVARILKLAKGDGEEADDSFVAEIQRAIDALKEAVAVQCPGS